jgi:hypothetical protein
VAQKELEDLQELLDREMCKKLQISRQQQGIGKATADANTHMQKIDSYIKYVYYFHFLLLFKSHSSTV